MLTSRPGPVLQDLSVWKDKYSLLGDTVGFLVATCEEPVVRELRDGYASLSARWDEVFQHVQQYMHAGDLLRLRREYRSGMDTLQRWLRAAETVLANLHLEIGSADRVKAYGQGLQQLQSEVEGMEQLFKSISKKFQSLIQDLSRQEVESMMETLKKEKGKSKGGIHRDRINFNFSHFCLFSEPNKSS